MDILLQYLNVRTQKQVFVKITDVPCYALFQAMHQEFELDVPYKALGLKSTLERLFGSNFLLTGIVDAAYYSLFHFRQNLQHLPTFSLGIDY